MFEIKHQKVVTIVLPIIIYLFDIFVFKSVGSEAVKKGKQSPWDTDFEEMARKTIVNWAFKFLPKTGISDSMIKVLETESQLDDEMFEDWKKAQGQKPDDFEEDDTPYAEEVK